MTHHSKARIHFLFRIGVSQGQRKYKRQGIDSILLCTLGSREGIRWQNRIYSMAYERIYLFYDLSSQFPIIPQRGASIDYRIEQICISAISTGQRIDDISTLQDRHTIEQMISWLIIPECSLWQRGAHNRIDHRIESITQSIQADTFLSLFQSVLLIKKYHENISWLERQQPCRLWHDKIYSTIGAMGGIDGTIVAHIRRF